MAEDNNSNSNEESKEAKYKFDQAQYDMLLRCSHKGDISEWDKWRKENPNEQIWLQGANLVEADLREVNLQGANVVQVDLSGAKLQGAHLGDANLQGANLVGAKLQCADLKWAELQIAHLNRADLQGANLIYTKLQGAVLIEADLQGANLRDAKLQGAVLLYANLQGAILRKSKLQGVDFSGAKIQRADFSRAIVDSETLIWECEIDRKTKFEGVALGGCRIYPETKQLLEYNIRRKNWEGWYLEHSLLRWPVWLFWLISDYGLRTWRVIATFFGLAITFAVVYWLCPTFVMVNQGFGDIRGFWHALYFSVVTMTTLGFGDIAANPDSWGGQTLLMLQVILGYVLLGALVTRFAVLFTAGGPAGRFSNEQEKKGQGE